MITLEEALVTGRGTERPINCPNPDHEDAHASASLNVVKGVWFCYGCHAKGNIEGHVPDPKQALKLLMEADEEPRRYPYSWLDIFDADHPSLYWSTRFGEATARAFRCGTDPVSGEATYPLIDPIGDVLGVVRRNHTGEGPKYRYPYRVRTSKCLFTTPIHDWVEVLVLVEGAADVMALHQGGLPDHWAVAGTYGAGLHAPQVELLAAIAPHLILLAYDDDDAGARATVQARQACASIAPHLEVRWSQADAWHPTAKDAAELPWDVRIPALVQVIDTTRSTR